MPSSAPAQLLAVVLKLIVIGFSGLFMGFLLTPSTWRQQSQPPNLSGVLHARAGAAGLDLQPEATATPFDPSPRALTGLDLHIGPGVAYLVLGTVPRGGRLEVVGRDESGQWLAVAFAGSTKVNGWVPSQSVAGVADVKSLPLAPVTFLP